MGIKPLGEASKAGPRQNKGDGRRAMQRKPSPTAMIETQLSPSHEPVLGLYLHVAYMTVMASFPSEVGRGEITPNIIGLLAILAQLPGLSQAEFARLIGLERATVGVTVSRAITAGFVLRDRAIHDSRSYALHLTPRGKEMLANLRQRVPTHERAVGSRLTLDERVQLRGLLDKLVYG